MCGLWHSTHAMDGWVSCAWCYSVFCTSETMHIVDWIADPNTNPNSNTNPNPNPKHAMSMNYSLAKFEHMNLLNKQHIWWWRPLWMKYCGRLRLTVQRPKAWHSPLQQVPPVKLHPDTCPQFSNHPRQCPHLPPWNQLEGQPRSSFLPDTRL